ncbi:DUF3422 family protein [Hyphococcus sp.]|uniref:DUF3422 family protein n=1 Tax=Hyphococcus sp. TaxID=2038636 RepID=UPI0035C6B407
MSTFQDKSFPDRAAIAEAIHRRYPLESGSLARAMKFVVSYPSLKDRFRHALAQDKDLVTALFDASYLQENKFPPAREVIRKAIEELGLATLDYEAPDNRQEENQERYKKIRERCFAAFRTASLSKSSLYRQAAKRKIDAFAGDLKGDSLQGHRFEDDSDDFNPDSNGSFSGSLTARIDQCHRMRLRWQGHTHNHSVMLVEDVDASGRQILEKFRAESSEDETLDGMTIGQIRKFASMRFDALTSLSEFYKETEQTEGLCDCASPLNCMMKDLDICRRGGKDGDTRKEIIDYFTPDVRTKPAMGVLNVASYWIMPIGIFLNENINLDNVKDEKTCGEGFDSVSKIKSDLKELLRKTHPKPKQLEDKNFSISEIELMSSSVQRLAIRVSRDELGPEAHGDYHFSFNSTESAPTDIAADGMLGEKTLRFIVKIMQQWFQYAPADGPQEPLPREDFVLSFLSHGRALLISDLRPERLLKSKNKYVDYATRTVILDLGMHKEERGRMLQRLMDIATFRHLGLRGYPYVNEATHALNHLGAALNKYGDAANDSNADDDAIPRLRERLKAFKQKNNPSELTKERNDIERDIDLILTALEAKFARILRISDALDLLNLFFTYGVSGKANSTAGYSRHIRENLAMLRESRAPGYQTLAGYLDRYFACAHEIETLRTRYQTLRERANEAADLIRTRLDQMLAIQLNFEAATQGETMDATRQTARRSMWIGFAAAGAGFVAALVAVYSIISNSRATNQLIERVDQIVETLSGPDLPAASVIEGDSASEDTE